MRNYILTELERDLIMAWLKSGTSNSTLRSLKTRAKKAIPRLWADLELLENLARGDDH